MKSVIHLDGKPITLEMADFDDVVNVDDMTRIHYENIYGDAVTVSALLNKVGILKSRAEEIHSEKKFEAEIEESNLKKNFRREAIENDNHIKVDGVRIKLTEKSLDDAVNLDKGLQVIKKNVIHAKRVYDDIESFYWGVQSKDKKLNNLISGLTEEELWNELVDGKINGILIKKRKSITERHK